ncbi:hypothetical protein J6590_008494 [Homalodisca vitripennis]|nr:hypothetical protein J6590_008494 [Homalodisca vitripennis]
MVRNLHKYMVMSAAINDYEVFPETCETIYSNSSSLSETRPSNVSRREFATVCSAAGGNPSVSGSDKDQFVGLLGPERSVLSGQDATSANPIPLSRRDASDSFQIFEIISPFSLQQPRVNAPIFLLNTSPPFLSVRDDKEAERFCRFSSRWWSLINSVSADRSTKVRGVGVAGAGVGRCDTPALCRVLT